MSFQAKYIILNITTPIPIVFSELINHSDMAGGRPVLGAGFCYINDKGRYSCYGKSHSLNINSDPERDAAILNKYLGVDLDY